MVDITFPAGNMDKETDEQDHKARIMAKVAFSSIYRNHVEASNFLAYDDDGYVCN